MDSSPNGPALGRPCLVLADADAGHAAQTECSFRSRGWDVHAARTGSEARRLVRTLRAQLVVLDTLLPEETGWLTCEKLTRELPGVRVLLVDPSPDAERESLASFVGAAALVARGDGAPALLQQAACVAVQAAG